ncbi:carboxypeptidase-like regulatory domain-containing protein [Pedobacter flavus]|uniref:Carboxypeptidase-like regulatory domain-containing protein n=1 Tax=Pedobacter flavus TaxID=3113906 RepID=A0ABU7GXT5_9SPHI|nr:carboxypeptidase-like regulatory domain-containing protein [Pedobacter sp. VNH31]MEE1883796.1 carboxypeptidase-like regulatory domain-containing protein [Pedobacter sp. VNH31]
MRSILLNLLLLFTIPAFGQKFTLSGTVKSFDNLPLAGATLYVSGTKISSVSNNEGRFQIELERGNYDILTQMMGYAATNTQVTINNEPTQVHIKLFESVYKIAEVEVRPDPERTRYINIFKDYFLGRTPNALKSKILNAEVLNIDFNKADKILKISSDQLLKIENHALGYKINYLISNFEYNFNTNVVFYEGYPAFEEMAGKESAHKKWAKAREIAYLGSSTHFFQTLAKKSSYQEGFLIYKISSDNNPLSANKNQGISVGLNMDRLSTQPVLLDTLVKHVEVNIYKLSYKDDLYVVYTKEKEPENFQWTGFKMNRTPEIKNYQVSRIIPLKLPVHFYDSGISLDPTATLFMGYFAWEKFADLLPIEYELPIKK